MRRSFVKIGRCGPCGRVAFCRNIVTMSILNEVGSVHEPEFHAGDRLRKAREVAGMDRQTLASRIDVHRQSVQRYEEGLAKPRGPVITAWAMATGVRREWLESGKYTPRDLNPEPTGSRRLTHLRRPTAQSQGSSMLRKAA